MALASACYISQLSGLGTPYNQNSLLTRCCFALDCRFVWLSSHILYNVFSEVVLPRGLWNREEPVVRMVGHVTHPPLYEKGPWSWGCREKCQPSLWAPSVFFPGKCSSFCIPNSLQMPSCMSSSTWLSSTSDKDRERCQRINKSLVRKMWRTFFPSEGRQWLSSTFFFSSFALSCKVTTLTYGSECCLDLINELR